jgi:hypothetical protein
VRALAFALASLGSLALACSRPSSAPEDAAASPTAGASSLAAPAAASVDAGNPRSTVSARRRSSFKCRAMAVQGSPSIALDGGAVPLAMNEVADGWVTLPTSADTLTVTLPRTGRELAFLGPAKLEPCVGTDEAWLVRGRFQGSRGSGEAPGAEQWVVTPFGTVRYGAAILEVVVEETTLTASLKGGTATVLPEGATSWELLDPKAPRVVKGAPAGRAATAASADRCAKAAAASKVLEDALVAPDAAASPTFGPLAMRANDAHVLARAACAVAKLRADAASGDGTANARP